ncbi:rhodanese-like domain-containing protein [Vulcanisaeta souniana]|uniref:rhodanese-like domain-containing protein n=1 Tax=Vulcanisaeta souniana TaxID=164452 RepID=UPI001FB3B22F|nr:rhodanese-like domain-containing protein [Vulcanisaeta souniana]
MLLNLYSDLLYGVGIIKGYYELMVDLVTRGGIARERHVVLLDEIDNRHSAIAYMVFKALGFRHVSILNGSKISWLIHKGPLCTCNGHAYKGSFDPRNC